MKFKPLNNKLLLKTIKSNNKTNKGIILPYTLKERQIKGKVIAIGSGKKNDKGESIPLEVKIGDIIIYQKWSGTNIKINEEEFLIIKETEVLGILYN